MNTAEKYYNNVFHFIRKRIKHIEDAEDLTQEVFYKMSIANLDNVSNIKSWIYAIARNTVIDFYRKRKTTLIELNDEEFLDMPLEPDESSINDLNKCIVPFIKRLPVDYKELMLESEIQNIPQKEIAQKRDMNYTTLRSKVQRGRKKLKEMIVDCCGDTNQATMDAASTNCNTNKKCGC